MLFAIQCGTTKKKVKNENCFNINLRITHDTSIRRYSGKEGRIKRTGFRPVLFDVKTGGEESKGEKMKVFGKRFIFANIAIVCVSVTACYLKYDAEFYLKIIGALATLYLGGQTFSDVRLGDHQK